ncbi:MAG: peptidylprolyl isomerase [Chitinophagaceae bacterium]|nr:peptidylprolyl isomerase [Chitinophagaceae bacterium]
MKNLIIFSLLFTSFQTAAQSLFNYGDHQVSAQEFLRAYNKNAGPEKPTEKSYREYLDLYIRFKLKVQAAYDKKMDTLTNQIAELQNFRMQVAEGFMKDDSSLQALGDEAFLRSRKDIRLAHIFIPCPANDTLTAYKKAMAAWKALGKKTAFAKVAAAFSSDSASFARGGDIGFVTVFTLPYPLESLAYSTPVGRFSKPFRSNAGYHIFKNLEERSAIGKIVVAQIELLFPPDATDSIRKAIGVRADSIYTALQQGADFKELAAKWSDDMSSHQSGGQLSPFGVGSYEPAFEEPAFALKTDGDITRPLQTSTGYHIVKRLSLVPVNDNQDSTDARAALTMQVRTDARMNISRQLFVRKAYQLTKLNKDEFDESKLLEYYKANLETFNPDFDLQIREFKEGNLLFEIMQSGIWEKAANDSVGLKKFFEANKGKYQWEPSADVIVFSCNDSATAIAVRSSFSINTAGWRDLVKENEGKAQADSGRYELNQLPVKDLSAIKAGIITQPVENKAENTTSFLYVKKVYSNKMPRSFNDARGFALNDYQAQLEEEWLTELKRKYPVKIDEGVLKSL